MTNSNWISEWLLCKTFKLVKTYKYAGVYKTTWTGCVIKVYVLKTMFCHA